MVSLPKFSGRVLHMLSVMVSAGASLIMYLAPDAGQRLAADETARKLFMVSGIVALSSGLFNMIITRPSAIMGREKATFWSALAGTKALVACVVFTPLLNRLLTDSDTVILVRFVTVIAFVFASAVLRFYREAHTIAKDKSK